MQRGESSGSPHRTRRLAEQPPTHLDGGQPAIFDDNHTLSTITVLVVDDNADLRDLTASFLERERDEFSVLTESSADDALATLEGTDVDAIVSDYEMPRMDGLEFLNAVRGRHEELPFILFTGRGSEEIASEAISKGVTDYLQKETGSTQYSLLANRLVNAVEQYYASETLKRSEEKFSKLVTNSTDVIAIVDENGQFQYISPACEHVLGYEQEELIGTLAFDYMPPEDRKEAMEEFFAALENPDTKPVIQFRFEDPRGGWTVIEARGKNMFDDEFINGFVVNGRDVTARKERQWELERQNEQLRDMRRVISHELRDPINIVTDALELYRDTGDGSYLGRIEDATERMGVLLDDIIALADHEYDIEETEQVSFEDVVQKSWEMVETDGAELHVNDSKALQADPTRLQQVFENLIQNSIEHSRGDVEIRVGTDESSIYYEDAGPGIPVDERDDVFESGYTTTEDNTGFGLNIVKQIVLGHGWEITIGESEDGGARFEITGVTFQPSVYR